MNYLLALIALVFIVFFMFSGKKVEKIPAKLKSSAKSFASGNKMVVGILVGLALCWVIGLFIKTEGFEVQINPRGDNPFMISGDNGQTILPGYIGGFWARNDPKPEDAASGAMATRVGDRDSAGEAVTDLVTWASSQTPENTLNVNNGDIQLIRGGYPTLQIRYAALLPTTFFDEIKSVIIDSEVITMAEFTDLDNLRSLMNPGNRTDFWFDNFTQNMYTLVELRRDIDTLSINQVLRKFHSIIKLSVDYPPIQRGGSLKEYMDDLIYNLDTRLNSRQTTIPDEPRFSNDFCDKLLFLLTEDFDPSSAAFGGDEVDNFNTDLQSKLQSEPGEYLIYINYKPSATARSNFDVIFKINNTQDGGVGDTGVPGGDGAPPSTGGGGGGGGEMELTPDQLARAGAAARALRSMGGGGGDGQVELTQETLCDGTADPSPTKAQIMGHLMDNSLFNEDNKGEIINRCCASTEGVATNPNSSRCLISLGGAYTDMTENNPCPGIESTFNFPFNELGEEWQTSTVDNPSLVWADFTEGSAVEEATCP